MLRLPRSLPCLVLLLSAAHCGATAAADGTADESDAIRPAAEAVETPAAGASAPPAAAQSGPKPPKPMFRNLFRATDEFSLVGAQSQLSYHKPTYALPLSYSNRYPGDETEFIFQLSLKLQLLKMPLYFGYTQRSYWQIYNSDESRPFRETNYDPEFFYRYQPRAAFCPGCGADLGFEHESNGREVAESRSWNRSYLALYRQSGNSLVYLKAWYRIPESEKKTPDDPKGDDNPDIARYLGHGELRIQHLLFDDHMLALMLRGNSHSGKGAVELNYSVPFRDYTYWSLYYFNGYGESLIDYDRSTQRIGIGVMLVR